jgi:simple sugar transport system ATP-binding protein
MIFDEPTAVLTPQEIDFLLQIIDNLRKGGKTIILITHKIAEIKRIADRCAILRRGKLIDVRNVAEATVQELADLMVGRQVEFTLEKSEPRFGEPVLEVRNLTVKNEQKFEVVRNVSFTVRGGEIFAIAGVSGNGQGEIADAIAGLAKIAGGGVTLNGKEITHESVRTRCLAGISYIPEDRQETGTIPDFTLQENLALREYFKEPFSKKGILNDDAFRTYAEKLIQAYDIRCARGPDTMLRSMSGGNQQKAIVAREIEEKSRLIIFVQPTRGMDIGAIENIHRQILQERERGSAILLISLELDEIMALADTIGIIYRGEMMKIAPATEMTTQEVGRYMMGVKEG